ncbi:TonB-dependent receptor [Glaciecola punicea]|uniref:TonB-dependent receptor n=1 Tax=Glaciecola punicea TaxID=56804 RepID=UPI000872B1E9|nr:TonB-dependent receptor [Glaciecola punicea]OFA32747.1 TonB-dependent receptor [Glaciecola punicea]
MQKNASSLRCTLGTLSVLLPLFCATAFAQQENDKENDKEIEVIEVTGNASNAALLSPKQSLIDGPFGDGLSIQDIARSVTPISAQMMEVLNITTLQDILAVSPSTYAASGFGAPSLPTIRGQLGELLQDGVRRQAGNNGFGVPLSFNAIEQVDVVKGPPPVMFGSSQRNGGFVNLQSKRASISKQDSKMSLSAGRWDSYRAQIDTSKVLVDNKSGLRLSYERIDNGDFYDFSGYKSDSLYSAFRLVPNSDSTWDINVEYYDVEYTDNAGINRPTQNLIDKGLYITGQGAQANGSLIPRAGSVISPTGEVRINRSQVLTDPGNINTATTFLVHSIYRRQLSDNARLKNTTYYQYLERESIAQNSFVEIIDAANTAQNRTELAYDWHHSQQSIIAFDVRYNSVLGYSQFTTEADAPIDLTGPIMNRRIPLTSEQQARLVELRPGVFVSPGGQYDINGDGAGDFSLSDTTDSSSWQTGLAVQHDSQWTDELSTSLGYRLDYYDVKAQDPIAPQGQVAVSDSINEILQSAQISVSYAITASLTSYIAGSYNEATSNSMAGGNVLGGDNTISELNFATNNSLFEAGIKYAPSDSHWYVDGAWFNQRRSLRNRDGSNTGVRATGLELQAFYTAERFWFNAGYTYIDARYDNSATSQGSRQVADAFDNTRADIIQGTGLGSPNFTPFAASNTQVQGIPQQSLGLNGGLNINEKWSAGFSGIYTKSYPLDFLATVLIRDQFTLDLNTRYLFSEQLALRFTLNNVTNEKNWRPVFEGGFFGSTLVFPELPIHGEVKLSYSF